MFGLPASNGLPEVVMTSLLFTSRAGRRPNIPRRLRPAQRASMARKVKSGCSEDWDASKNLERVNHLWIYRNMAPFWVSTARTKHLGNIGSILRLVMIPLRNVHRPLIQNPLLVHHLTSQCMWEHIENLYVFLEKKLNTVGPRQKDAHRRTLYRQ